MGGYGQATARDITAGELIRESQQKLLHLQDMAQNMKGRIFWGREHIFYVRVMKVTEANDEYTVSPRHLQPDVTGATVDYMLENSCVYAVDIKNLCATETPNLYLYKQGTHQDAMQLEPVSPRFPQNPFSLWTPPPMPGTMVHAFPGMVRLFGGALTHGWSELDLELRDYRNRLVLRMRFRVQSRVGLPAFDASRGMRMQALLQQLGEAAV